MSRAGPTGVSPPPAADDGDGDGFDPLEATVADVHRAFETGALTAEALVERYLARIDAYDDALNAILTVNPAARERAADLDEAHAADGPVGPLHGVPVVIKDNHDTHEMPTTAGSRALADCRPDRDAAVVERLREAGAVILAKANLQELSFGVDSISSLGGATRNAYDTDHRPSGSSGGTAAAVAANLGLVGTGTDTCSSVRSPPAFNGLVGLRPTRGLVSRTGIVPLSETQDTAGPITRTVADAARLLDAMVGYDPADPVSARGVDRPPADGYAARAALDAAAGALADARIGVARDLFEPVGDPPADAVAAVTDAVDGAIDELAAAGATVVDPVAVPDDEFVAAARVLGHEFERDFDRYLAELGDAAPHDSLAAVAATGEIAPSIAERIEEGGILGVDAAALDRNVAYLRSLRRRREIADRLEAIFADHDLDALLYPPSTVPPVEIPAHQPFAEMRCELAAHTGFPALVLPAGLTDDGLPVGLELLGRPFAEPRLLELGADYERAAEPRRPPTGFGPLD